MNQGTTSTNFDFLQEHDPLFVELAASAERAFASDPNTTLIKLRQFAEAIACFSEVAFGFKHPEWQPLSYFEAGRCYVQLKNVTAARKMLTAVVKEFPKHARVKDAQAILKQLK